MGYTDFENFAFVKLVKLVKLVENNGHKFKLGIQIKFQFVTKILSPWVADKILKKLLGRTKKMEILKYLRVL